MNHPPNWNRNWTLGRQLGKRLSSSPTRATVRLLVVEVAIHANAPGCVTDRIGFLEGWYVDPLFRRQGIGSALNAVAEAWARDRGCAEMASDTTEEYPASPAAHRGVGYTQVDSFNFAKRLI
jgi:GNAT superfamily N-acetyltransferase